MQTYIGTKIIKAKPMTRDAAEALLGRNVGGDKTGDGYLVEYEGGYQAWGPKDAFEDAYRLTSGMPFGLALEALKKGKRVARAGWNGKGMYLFLTSSIEFNTKADLSEFNPTRDANETGDNAAFIHAAIGMRTAQRTLVIGWLASQTDMLADDWVIVE